MNIATQVLSRGVIGIVLAIITCLYAALENQEALEADLYAALENQEVLEAEVSKYMEIKQCGNEWRYCDGACANCAVNKTFTTDRTEIHGMSAGEAIERLKRMYDLLIYGIPMDPHGEEAQNFNAIITAISALEKQVPMPPYVHEIKYPHMSDITVVQCPTCNRRLRTKRTTAKGDSYCPDCGQKIDG